MLLFTAGDGLKVGTYFEKLKLIMLNYDFIKTNDGSKRRRRESVSKVRVLSRC